MSKLDTPRSGIRLCTQGLTSHAAEVPAAYVGWTLPSVWRIARDAAQGKAEKTEVLLSIRQ